MKDKLNRREKAHRLSNNKIFNIKFQRKNYLTFIGGLTSIFLGYILLANGSISLAPILLVLGYCVIIPVSILIK
jgi:hypothetical protein